jgi:hypothetical protein
MGVVMKWKMGLLLLVGLLGDAALAAEQNGTLAAAVERDNALDDCRKEGKAEGLQGEALEHFVKDCVESVLGVEFDNRAKR